jgi:hypothetical protein
MSDAARYVSRIALVAVALPSMMLAPLATSCSPGSSPPDASGSYGALCPAALSEAIGAPCATEGLSCSPQYLCGIAPATATCTCASGVFACVDVTGAAIEGSDAEPACPSRADAQACPATEHLATNAACTETGLVCTYKAPCDATPGFDQCQCAAGPLPTGVLGLRFQCTSACTYAGPVDLATGDAAPDSTSDGPGGEGPPADAAPADAPGDVQPGEASD